MSDTPKPGDDFLRHWAEKFRDAKQPEGAGWLAIDYASHAAVYAELLQRRKDGGSPEEFVVKMAERLKEVAPEVQANFLAHLSTIRDSLLRIRTIEGVSMKPGGWE